MEKLKKITGRFIVFIDTAINLYLYFIVVACILSLIPNINPNYPLFNYIFRFAGFYLIPPVFGFSFSPMIIMIAIVLISMGLRKLYIKYFNNEPPVYVISAEEFFEKLNEHALENSESSEDNTADNNETSDDKENEE